MNIKKSTYKARIIFAKKLREIRLKKGFTQESLAEEAGLHRTYIGSVERGERNISIDNIERLANALNVNLQTLLSEDNDETT